MAEMRKTPDEGARTRFRTVTLFRFGFKLDAPSLTSCDEL
jgi:hypothetical protein